jgi:hypothetical protein
LILSPAWRRLGEAESMIAGEILITGNMETSIPHEEGADIQLGQVLEFASHSSNLPV